MDEMTDRSLYLELNDDALAVYHSIEDYVDLSSELIWMGDVADALRALAQQYDVACDEYAEANDID